MSDWTAFQMRSMLNGSCSLWNGAQCELVRIINDIGGKQEQRLNTETLGLLVLSQGS